MRCPIKKPTDWIDLTKEAGSLGREDCQAQWQGAIAEYLNNVLLLDVGAGLCESKTRMAIRNIKVTTQDTYPESPADIKYPVEQIPDNSYDAVTCFDVLEHVEDQLGFLKALKRVSRRWVALSTPNYLVSHNSHRFHVRELCPDEIIPLGIEAGLEFHLGWCQLPGRGVFMVRTREEFEGYQDTHGFCVLFSKNE